MKRYIKIITGTDFCGTKNIIHYLITNITDNELDEYTVELAQSNTVDYEDAYGFWEEISKEQYEEEVC